MKRPWLAPFTPLYAAGVALRNRRIENGTEPVRRLRWPVVSVGNLSTGGSGKTPLTIALAKALAERGFHVDVLSRGYGRRSKLAARVLPGCSAEEFGDEPLLIARETGVPVYVARQRYEAGLLAEADGASGEPSRGDSGIDLGVHLLDDGFQHRQLARDVDILLLNREDWLDCLLPGGNLREPIRALRRATVVAIPATETELEAELRTWFMTWGWQGPVWRLHRTMEVQPADGPVGAFCGIARPEQFFAGLEAAGLRIANRSAFPDHHGYTPADLRRLAASARAAGATVLVTTEKDQVRLGALASTLPASLPLKTAGLRVEIEEQDISWLIDRLKAAPAHPPL